MRRFLAYLGAPVFLDSLLVAPPEFVAASEPFDTNPGWHAVDPDTVATFDPGAEPLAEPFQVSAR